MIVFFQFLYFALKNIFISSKQYLTAHPEYITFPTSSLLLMFDVSLTVAQFNDFIKLITNTTELLIALLSAFIILKKHFKNLFKKSHSEDD